MISLNIVQAVMITAHTRAVILLIIQMTQIITLFQDAIKITHNPEQIKLDSIMTLGDKTALLSKTL